MARIGHLIPATAVLAVGYSAAYPLGEGSVVEVNKIFWDCAPDRSLEIGLGQRRRLLVGQRLIFGIDRPSDLRQQR